jgi:hypothetical protein
MESNPLIFLDLSCLSYRNRRFLHRCARWSILGSRWMVPSRNRSSLQGMGTSWLWLKWVVSIITMNDGRLDEDCPPKAVHTSDA